jgi:drug/metabolite transporter (DMT)-like permease
MSNTFLYVITVLIWGSTWIAINYQLGDVPPEASIIYRFGLAALILFAYCRFKNRSLTFNIKQHVQFILFGLTLFGCNYYFIYSAQQHINSALTSIAFSMIMFFNVVNARIWFKTKITQQTYIGAILGLIGIIVLFWPQINDTDLGKESLLGLSLCLIGTLLASTGNMVSMKNKLMNLPMMQANAWGMFYGTLIMTTVLLAQGKSFSFSYTLPYISSLLYLSIFGSIIAFASYLTLLNNIGAHKASYTSVMFPAVAVIISTIVEGFSWNIYTVVGLLIIVAGNIAVLTKPRKISIPVTSQPKPDF